MSVNKWCHEWCHAFSCKKTVYDTIKNQIEVEKKSKQSIENYLITSINFTNGQSCIFKRKSIRYVKRIFCL